MKVVKITLFLLFIIIFFVGIFFLPRVIKINFIKCSNQFGDCDDAIVEELNKLAEKSYFETKNNIIKYLSSNYLISDYSLQYQIPFTLKVFLIEEKPSFALKIDKYLLISKTGKFLKESEVTDLPYLNIGSISAKVGENINEKVLFALNLLYDINKIYGVSYGGIKNTSVEFKIPAGPYLIFPLEGDKDVLIGALRITISQLNKGTENPRIEKALSEIKVDFRYKNPVVR